MCQVDHICPKGVEGPGSAYGTVPICLWIIADAKHNFRVIGSLGGQALPTERTHDLLPPGLMGKAGALAHKPTFAGTFEPEAVSILQAAFDRVWADLEPWTDSSNRDQVREDIARAITDLARRGECSPGSLETYALERAMMSLKRSRHLN